MPTLRGKEDSEIHQPRYYTKTFALQIITRKFRTEVSEPEFGLAIRVARVTYTIHNQFDLWQLKQTNG